MSPLLVKGLIAAGGISLGGVGVWQLGKHMEPKTLRQKLEGDGLVFLDLEGDKNLSEWKKRALNHKNGSGDSTTGQTTAKFEDLNFNSTSENDNDGRSLRDKCRSVASMELGGQNEEENIKKLKGWCMVTNAAPSVPGVGG